MHFEPNNLNICDNLLVALRRCIRAIDLHSKQLVSQFGLTGPQILILKTAYESDNYPTTSTEIAKKVSLSTATVTSILDRLADKNYIQREKSPSDKRKTLIRTTKHASAIFDKNPTLLQEDFIKQFMALKKWEQLAMLSAVERMADLMNAKTIDAAPVLTNEDLTNNTHKDTSAE